MSDLPIHERIPASVQEALGHAADNDFAIAMSNLVYAREATVGFSVLTAPEKVVFCLDKLEQEVNNGGFQQYFSNSSGDHAAETPAALRTLGAPQVASIVEKALKLFPDHQDALAELDEAFLAYPEPLAQLERAYVRKHQELFLVPRGAGKSILSL